MHQRSFTPMQQYAMMKKEYNEGIYRVLSAGRWEWISTAQPTERSPMYNFRMVYEKDHPEVFIIDHLEKAEGYTQLPHVYDNKKQRLCLYFSAFGDWTPKIKVSVVVPWISEWLYFYEMWVVTGEWYGGGIHIELEDNPKKGGKKKHFIYQ